MLTIQQANHGFTVSMQSGKAIFAYQQEKYRTRNLLPIGGCALPLVSFLFVGLMQPGSMATGIVWWLLFYVGSFLLIKYLMNLQRKERSFAVEKDGFEIDDKKYLRKDITSMFIQQGNSKPVVNVDMNSSTGTFIAFQANPAGLMAASAANAAHAVGKLGDAAGQKFRENIARLNCKVFIRYGNKNIVLAKGITMDTAEVMLDKIVEVTQTLHGQ